MYGLGWGGCFPTPDFNDDLGQEPGPLLAKQTWNDQLVLASLISKVHPYLTLIWLLIWLAKKQACLWCTSVKKETAEFFVSLNTT